MRKIKFRAYSDQNGMEMIDDLYWFEENGVHTEEGIGHNRKYHLMQFVGMHDKDGNEIYEGDIVYFPPLDDVSDVKIIKWSENDCGFVVDKPDGTPDSWIDDSAKIIGNIYENPGLIKGNNES